MLFDFNTDYEKVAGNYDFCICGAGAAGITLAVALAQSGKKVVLLEGGGQTYSSESQNLYSGEVVGHDPAYPLAGVRLRYLGGTTNHWTGRCTTFKPYDFERKLDSGLPGWPLAFEEFDKYLKPAMAILDLKPADGFSDGFNTNLKTKSFEPDLYQNSPPTRFAEKFKEELVSLPKLDVFINASVVNINCGQKGSVSAITISNFKKNARTIKSKHYVLAMGAVENARTLLFSDSVYKRGVGNDSDMVGRCFMEHYNVEMGVFIPNEALWKDREAISFYTTNEFVDETNVGSSNVSLTVLGAEGRTNAGRLGPLRQVLKDLSCKYDLSDKLQFVFTHQCSGDGVVGTLTEQFPNLNSRITLSQKVDFFERRKVKLNWDMSDSDKSTIRRIAVRLAKDVSELNIGHMRLPDYILETEKRIVARGHAHQMGTTRMAANPKHGVVDSNSKVFGIDNLYIAGSSIFSTGGGGNPTLPIVQFTLRLKDHLLSL